MIYIREDNHTRISGITSLYITFDTFSQDIVNIIKSCGMYFYDKKTKTWEIPVKSLSYIVDNLVYCDDIDLSLYWKEDKTKDVKLEVIPREKPFNHQIEAVKWGLVNDTGLLLDAPGLGKSYSIIMLAEELKAKENIEHCLVICGINTLKTNWEKEIARHSHLDSVIIGKRINSKGKVVYNSIKSRAEQLVNPIKEFFIIINVESLRDKLIIDAINNSSNKIDMMVFDEVHKAKGWNSQQGQNLLSLKAKHMIGMTGTVIMNNPLDAYMPLAWIGKEKKHNVTNFKKTYCVFDSFTRGRIVGFKNLDVLKDEIESCSLRRTKEEVLKDLPTKTIIREYIEMNDAHRQFYDAVKDGVKEECDKINLNATNLLSLVIRLRQATSCPQLLTSNNIMSSKIERCIEIVNDLVSNKEKVVIFSNFKEPVYQLKELLKEYKPLIGTGDMKDDEVSNNIDLFQNDNEHMVFIGTSQKMGTGITLTRASYAIFIDCDWTSALQEQCEDRVHRIGSTKPVFIYRLICEDTIDEKVEKILTRKEAISDFIVDDKCDDNTMAILKDFII